VYGLHLFKMKQFASCILASDVKDILTLVENNVIRCYSVHN